MFLECTCYSFLYICEVGEGNFICYLPQLDCKLFLLGCHSWAANRGWEVERFLGHRSAHPTANDFHLRKVRQPATGGCATSCAGAPCLLCVRYCKGTQSALCSDELLLPASCVKRPKFMHQYEKQSEDEEGMKRRQAVKRQGTSPCCNAQNGVKFFSIEYTDFCKCAPHYPDVELFSP